MEIHRRSDSSLKVKSEKNLLVVSFTKLYDQSWVESIRSTLVICETSVIYKWTGLIGRSHSHRVVGTVWEKGILNTHPPTCVHPHACTEVTRKRCEIHDWLFVLLVTSVESADVIHAVVCLYSHSKHPWHRKHIQETLPNYTCSPAIKKNKMKFYLCSRSACFGSPGSRTT